MDPYTINSAISAGAQCLVEVAKGNTTQFRARQIISDSHALVLTEAKIGRFEESHKVLHFQNPSPFPVAQSEGLNPITLRARTLY